MSPGWAGGLLAIDLDALALNWTRLRDEVAPAACAAVIKADGYGLGAVPVALRLERAGCGHFFVAHLHEGAALRAAGVRCPAIYVLNGPPPGCSAEMRRHDLIPVLNSMQQVAEWRALPRPTGRTPPAALQVDTGMSRFGLSFDELRLLADDPSGLELVLLMSHLGCAETPEHPLNATQRACFAECLRLLPGVPASLAASSAIFHGPETHLQMVRPGAALYGVNPTPARPNPMRPVIRLDGRVVQTRWIEAGASVGYGACFVAEAPCRIATVAVGYADGFLRAAGCAGRAGFLDGVRLPVVGRVSMDCLGLDATALGDAPLPAGTAIELIGPHHSLDEAAAAAGTIGYELLIALGARYHRTYLGEVVPA